MAATIPDLNASPGVQFLMENNRGTYAIHIKKLMEGFGKEAVSKIPEIAGSNKLNFSCRNLFVKCMIFQNYIVVN